MLDYLTNMYIPRYISEDDLLGFLIEASVITYFLHVRGHLFARENREAVRLPGIMFFVLGVLCRVPWDALLILLHALFILTWFTVLRNEEKKWLVWLIYGPWCLLFRFRLNLVLILKLFQFLKSP